MKRDFIFSLRLLYIVLLPSLSYADAPLPGSPTALTGPLASWAPVLVIIIAWVIVAGKMGGGKFGRSLQVQEEILKTTQENLEIQKQILDVLKRR